MTRYGGSPAKTGTAGAGLRRCAALGALFLSACTTSPAPAAAAGEIVSLPEPRAAGAMSLEEAIQKRRSVRTFTVASLAPEEIGQLVWAAQGITDRASGHRAAPSAGALYPLEVYVFNKDGVFHYLPDGHRLQRVSRSDLRRELAGASLGAPSISAAPVDIVITGVVERTRSRYGGRAERYVYLEAGHAAENVLLEAVALNLGAVPIGAFDDEAVRRVLSIASNERPIYVIPVGR